jgi:hypothetical protein
MFQSGATTTDSDGRYRLYFAENGGRQAIVSASKPGMAEVNLGRQGEFAVLYEQPKAGELSDWLAKRPLLLPHKPSELNFTLSHVGTLAVRINREEETDLSGISVCLKGANLPPGSNVIDSATTDKRGEVSFAEVPLDRYWWIEIGRSETVRTKPFKLTDPQRYQLLLDWRTDSTGVDALDIMSLIDALQMDRTLELVSAAPPRMHAD